MRCTVTYQLCFATGRRTIIEELPTHTKLQDKDELRQATVIFLRPKSAQKTKQNRTKMPKSLRPKISNSQTTADVASIIRQSLTFLSTIVIRRVCIKLDNVELGDSPCCRQ